MLKLFLALVGVLILMGGFFKKVSGIFFVVDFLCFVVVFIFLIG